MHNRNNAHQKHFGQPFLLYRGMLLLLTMLGVSGIVLAAHSVRGRGDCIGTIVLTPIGGAKSAVKINTVGNITHLGKSSVSLDSVADFSGPVPLAVPPTHGTVTAANGDTIKFVLKWTAQTVSAGVFDVTGPFEVTGGTGRFTAAGGGGLYVGRIDTQTGLVKATIEGLLTR